MSLLPHFLIIGAMKSGTTSLHRDLNCHPKIFLPENKEPECLCSDDVETPSGLARYESLFRPSKSGQIRGEASTAYTKLPDYPGVAARALRVLGGSTKLIYIVRDPIQRIISHHYHDYRLNGARADINQVVLEDHRYLNYSRYSMQLEPWIEAFGLNQIAVVSFEEFVRSRLGVLKTLCTFLGVDPNMAQTLGDVALNSSASKHVVHPRIRSWLRRSAFYQNRVKPMLPWRLRGRLARLLSSKAPPPPLVLTQESIQRLREGLRPDIEQFCRLVGRRFDEWELFWEGVAAL